MKVKLSAIVDAMEMADYGMDFYLNKVNGKILQVSGPIYGETDETWVYTELIKYKDSCIKLPGRFDIDVNGIMEGFIGILPEGKNRERLLRAIRVRGAYGRFKDLIYRLNLEQDWHAYRDKIYRDLALGWCAENQIEIDG